MLLVVQKMRLPSLKYHKLKLNAPVDAHTASLLSLSGPFMYLVRHFWPYLLD